MRFTGTIRELCDVNVAEFSDDRTSRAAAMRLVDTYYPGCKIAGVGVWSVAPGQKHPMHVDDQPLEWIVRVHIPLTTNPDAIFIMRDGKYHMKVGKAYEFNTLAEHAVENLGVTMRDHFIIEVVNA